MRSNPGGYIPPGQVIGRDTQIRRYWNVLEGRSLVLSAERRMGKTTIIRKMEAVRDVLTLLQLAHYLERNEEGNYLFRSSFIQQYWCFERGL
jgi:hypothetical protein